MTDVLSEADRDACAREAVVAIEAVLDRRSPEMRIAFWAAVALHYRSDPEPGAAPQTNLGSARPAQLALVSP